MLKVFNEAKRRVMDLPSSERALLIRDCWDGLTGRLSTERCLDYLTSRGWDVSGWDPDTFNDDWDLAGDYDEIPDEEDGYEDGINTREDAYRWLQDKIAEHGNTAYFPQYDKIKLDQLIDRFGNTYFWRR